MQEEQPKHTFLSKSYRSPTNCDVCGKLLWGISRQGYSCSYCNVNVHRKCIPTSDSVLKCSLSKSVARRNSSVDLSGGKVESSASSAVSSSSSLDSEAAFLLDGGQDLEVDYGLEYPVNKSMVNTGSSSSTTALDQRSTGLSGSKSSTNLRQINTLTLSQSSIVGSTPSLTKKTSSLSLFTRNNSSSSSTTASQQVSPIQSPVESNDSVRQNSLPKPGVFRDLLETAAAKAADLRRNPISQPKLGVFTTLPKNFRNFVMKSGPMASIQTKVEELLFWKVPSESFLVLVVWSFLCLNPRMIFFIPHVSLIGLIIYNYFLKTQKQGKEKLAKVRQHKSSRSEPPKPLSATSHYPEHIDYRKNMTFIQNLMGFYCDVYDACIVLQSKIDWSDEKTTKFILQLCFGTLILMIFTHAFIPWNYVMLLCGWVVFCANTAFGKALGIVALKWTEEHIHDLDLQKLIEKLSKSIKSRSRKISHFTSGGSKEETGTVVIEIVENQRWWAGLGWVSHMLRNERPSWSNSDGSIRAPALNDADDPSALIKAGLAYSDTQFKQKIPAEDFQQPTNWKWSSDSEWLVDKNWSIGNECTDDEGWLYSDHNWSVDSDSASNSYTTRRRRYYRQANAVEE